MSNQQFKVIFGLDANAQNISNAAWDGNIISVAKGGTGTATGSITGTGALNFTAGGANSSIVLTPTGTGTVNVGGFKVTNMATPVSGTDATTKDYVDNLVQGLIVKNAVKVATTTNITLSGTQTIDGYSVQVNDRVLVKNQTAPAENGIYSAQSSTWTRTTDADTWDELISAYVFVQLGSTQADTGWVCTIDSGGTLGVTAVTWAQFSGAGTFTAGQGLLLASNAFSIDLVGTSGKIVVTTADTQTLINKTLQAAIVDTSISATAGAGSIINTSVISNSFTSSSAGQILDTTATATYRSISYIIQVVNSGLDYYQQSQVNVIWKSGTAYMTEYANLLTDSSLATYSVDISGGNVRLLVTPTGASGGNPSTFKVLKSTFTL
tara:strand:+ start:335 stop:1474 length:1140 start_codon:yes stop_codon:yes gene_type:complete